MRSFCFYIFILLLFFVVLGIELSVFTLSYVPRLFYFLFCFETGSLKSLCCPDLTSTCDPPEITSLYHYTWLKFSSLDAVGIFLFVYVT